MTCSRRKICAVIKKITLLTLLSVVLIYIGASFVDYSYYTGNSLTPWAVSPRKCIHSKHYTARLIDIANQTHVVLDSMGIEHWLIYGSLWGPLRGIPGPLPWDHDVDFGIDGDGNFSKISLEEFKATFKAAGLSVEDTLQETSTFLIQNSLGITVFYNYRGTMMRAGYEPWIFFINYRLYHSFPARLVKQPLSKVRFGSFNISVPREGIEIMKHLYPFNWRKVVKPASCENQ